MRGKLALLIGFGAGYVLGTRAGQERYEQLSRLYDNLTSSPGFQKLKGQAKDAVGSGFDQARGKAAEGVSKVTEAVKDKTAGHDQSGLSVAPPPSTQ